MTNSNTSDVSRWPSKASSQSSAQSLNGSAKTPASRRQPIRSKSVKNSNSAKNSKRRHRNRRDEILNRLGTTAEEVASQLPQIAPLLRQLGIRADRVVDVLRCDTEPESMEFVRLWDSLTPASRSMAGVEGVALGANISLRRIWELFCGAGVIQSQQITGVKIALELPEIVGVALKGAKKAKGYADREHIFKAARVLPTPKGSTTVIQVGNHGERELEGDDEKMRELEPADDAMLKFSKVMNPGKALPPAPAIEMDEPEIIEDEPEDE